MDLKDIENKQALKESVDALLSEYSRLFLALSGNPATYKKAALLFYWLRDYKNFIKNETAFSSNYCPDFPRGSIVNLNLGFNLGSELGGLHYGVVLQRSRRNNPNLIIAPMTSVKDTKDTEHLPPCKVFLGEELYFKIQGKYEGLKVSIPSEAEILKSAVESVKDEADKARISAKIEDLSYRLDTLRKTQNKLAKLKHGSIVAIDQIRSVSKMRLIDPTNKYDVLYGLKLSNASMDAIDKCIIETLTKCP